MDYKLSIFGSRIHKDIIISEEIEKLSIGTYKDCQFYLKRKRFFSDFKILVNRQGGSFIVSCEGPVYFVSESKPEIKEELTVLIPGERKELRYRESNITFLYLDFSFEFGNIQENYNYCIETPVGGNYVIGNTSVSDIYIDDALLEQNYIVYSHLNNDLYEIDSSNSKYGVCVNGVFISEPRIRLANKSFFSLGEHIFYIDGDRLRTSSTSSITTRLTSRVERESNNCLEYPRFIRSVRQRYTIPKDKIKVILPSNMPKEPTKAYLFSMLPMLVTMGGMMVLRVAMGSNSFYIYYFIFFMVSSIMISVLRFVRARKEYKKKVSDRIEKYNAYIEKKVKAIEDARAEEKLIFNKMEISAQKSLEEIETFDSHLFEKEKDHEDYLCINIGQGTTKSANQVEFSARETIETEDELMNYPEQIHDSYEYLSDIPVVLNLKDNNAIGIVGNRDKLYSMLKNIAVSLSAQHFYSDMKIFVIAGKEDAEKISWLRWIKHTTDDNGKRLFIYDENSAKSGQEYLYNLLTQREQSKSKNGYQDYVVLVFRPEMISGHPITKYVSQARSLGFTFVFFEEHEELLNHDCNERVFLDANANQGFIQNADNGTNQQSFTYAELPDEAVQMAAEKMAGVFVDEISIESRLPKNVSLYSILGILNAYDLDLENRWNTSKVYESMAAPLGIRGDGSVLALDIHEKAHGPHGLVAGTTGSGKSEIIQSFILSLASYFHPYEVGFIIIDFKGGGMANQFKKLPHLNGTITNIDGKQIDRSLSSIRAELMKRQELFAKYEVNHIDDYIKLYRQRVTTTPLPHLILIVDEFAELKSEQPEFMKELISTARIGRSLGVHLILATQKPAGVVNDQIWSNSKFKLCLKVQDQRDSNEVLKSPLAAEIKEPGRAYLQVGNNEIFELFQSGYSGASTHVSGLDEKSSYSIDVVALDGSRSTVYKQGNDDSGNDETQLDAIVKRIEEYCEQKNISKLSPICLPPLPEIINFPSDGARSDSNDIVVDYGIYDEPARQAQTTAVFNLTLENSVITGTSQSGKTNFLQTIIKSAALKYSPKEITFYVMDFASMVMGVFAGLTHVGGVATIDEPEKVKNLVGMLYKEINIRKNIFAEMGISSFSAYREAGLSELPQIVLMIDNYTSLKEIYPEYIDLIVDICREGSSMGITTIITSPQATGLGAKILSSCPKRIALNSNDDMDFALLFNKCRLRPDNFPGRGIVNIDRDYYEVQTYLAFDAEREIDKIGQIKEFIDTVNSKYKDHVKRFIPVVPDVFEESFVWDNYENISWAPYKLLLGINYSDTQPITMDLLRNNMLAISGKGDSGKNTYLKYVINSFNSRRSEAPIEFHVMDSYERAMEDASKLETVKTYTLRSDVMDQAVDEIVRRLSQRKERMLAGEMDILDKEPLIVIILNSDEYYSAASSSPMTMSKYKEIVQKYSAMKVAIILSDLPNASIMFGATELARLVCGFKHIVMFENLGGLKIIDVPMAFQKANRKQLKPGEMYFYKEGDIMKAKTPIWRENGI